MNVLHVAKACASNINMANAVLFYHNKKSNTEVVRQFKASMVYGVSFRPTRAKPRNPVLKER